MEHLTACTGRCRCVTGPPGWWLMSCKRLQAATGAESPTWRCRRLWPRRDSMHYCLTMPRHRQHRHTLAEFDVYFLQPPSENSSRLMFNCIKHRTAVHSRLCFWALLGFRDKCHWRSQIFTAPTTRFYKRNEGVMLQVRQVRGCPPEKPQENIPLKTNVTTTSTFGEI